MRMLSCIHASHGVSQRTMGMRRCRRALRHLGSRRASVQRSACVSGGCTGSARTVVVVSVSRIQPLLLVRRSGRHSDVGLRGHARGRIVRWTHGSSRRQCVSTLEAGWTSMASAGGVEVGRASVPGACPCRRRAALPGCGRGRVLSAVAVRCPGRGTATKLNKHSAP